MSRPTMDEFAVVLHVRGRCECETDRECLATLLALVPKGRRPAAELGRRET